MGTYRVVGYGFWIFLLSDIVMFSAFFATYAVLSGATVALVALGIAQMGIHLVFFLHITTAPDNTNNALALAFGTLIVFFVVVGSLWIMGNMNHMSVPMHQQMSMQP